MRLLESSPADVDDDGSFVPHVLRFSPEALETLFRFEREIEVELGPRGRLSGIQHWSGKLVGNTVRIAALLHLAQVAEDIVADLWGTPVSRWAMESAVRLAHPLADHALRVFAMLNADQRVRLAQHALTVIESLPPDSTVRDLFNRVRGKRGLGTMSELNAVIDLLEDHELARRRKQANAGVGRTPSPLIDINPEIRNGDPQNTQNPQDAEDGGGFCGYCGYRMRVPVEIRGARTFPRYRHSDPDPGGPRLPGEIHRSAPGGSNTSLCGRRSIPPANGVTEDPSFLRPLAN